ncbi:MAG: MlaD family protein [Vulcanimicrobiaceae bacterium]
MSKQAQVGVFALLALLMLFGVFYVITDFGTRHTGYKVGIHFNSAAGLPTGALVYFSGVTVGSVDSIELLPDNTVDVIIAVNRDIDIPKTSRFLIQAPLTGSPSLVIVPPPPPQPQPIAVLEHRVLPVPDQPHGTDSATIADLLDEGQGEIKRLDSMLAELQRTEPQMLGKLNSALDNADKLSRAASQTLAGLSAQGQVIAKTLAQAGNNVDQLTAELNSTAGRSSAQVDRLLGSLNNTAVALNQSVDSLRDIATNKRAKKNLLATTQNIADLTETLAGLTKDLRNVTGDPQTQSQLRDTAAQIDAASQKANSLLAGFGGTSHVYGVDPDATPYPVPTGSYPPVPRGAPLPQMTPQPTASHAPGPLGNVRAGFNKAVRNLAEVQFRFSYLNTATVLPGNNPLLTQDRGPQTDVNLVLLPRGATSLITGANNIGAITTYNFALRQNVPSGVYYGGGVLYSQFGLMGGYNGRHLGIEGLAYNLRLPEVDVYGNFRLTRGAKLFLGERDLNHVERRTVLGLQLSF